MKYLFLSLFSLLSATAVSQDCECIREFDFVVNYYEENLPGFSDNVTDNNKATYEQLKAKWRTQAGEAESSVDCFKALNYFVEFFRDNHSKLTMSMPSVDENDAKSVEKFKNSEVFKSREKIAITESEIKQFPQSDIRGIYQTADSIYVVAVIESKNEFRDYVGVIIHSQTSLWEVGHVKFELKKKEGNVYDAWHYARNHSLSYDSRCKLKSGILGGSWFKTSLKQKQNPSENLSRKVEFRLLNDSVSYLRIPSFGISQNAKLESFYEATAKQILSKPYLIVDVRNNGGGSDRNARGLLDYIYTKPIKTDAVDLYATKGNIERWSDFYENLKNDKKNIGRSEHKFFKQTLKDMEKAKPGTFVTRSKGGYLTWNIPENRPKKVIILQNRHCASSCETLILWAKQSDNTILAGENSGGFIGYGEAIPTKTPCYNFRLSCTITRYQEQRKYETIGISPDIELNYQEDWIIQALRHL